MDELTLRIEALEWRLGEALGQDGQNHPEILAKEIAALRGKVAAMYEFQQLMDARMRQIQSLLEGLHDSGLN